jgi:hypothetical protein
MEARPQQVGIFLQLLIWILVLVGLYLSSLYNYLLFHTLAELFSVIIAVGVFNIAWNSRRFLENNYLLFLGIAFLFVGAIDLLTLWPTRVCGSSPNLAPILLPSCGS